MRGSVTPGNCRAPFASPPCCGDASFGVVPCSHTYRLPPLSVPLPLSGVHGEKPTPKSKPDAKCMLRNEKIGPSLSVVLIHASAENGTSVSRSPGRLTQKDGFASPLGAGKLALPSLPSSNAVDDRCVPPSK